MRNIKEQAMDLVSKMTLEEKVSQMLFTAAPVKRLGIPAYNWWNEALHGIARSGVATVFPQAIGLAATFDPAFLKKVASAIADEGRAKYNAYQEESDYDIYKGLTFWSPNINIFRDPRWGRGHETYGECPYLTARLGVAFIEGLQGDDPDFLKSAACAKHFAVHSGPEEERHSFNAIANDYDLWNTYLPAFKAAVEEGKVESVMGAYNRTNGEPCCGSKTLLIDILRDKWHFDGHVVSDCWAIKDFHEFHKVTSNALESVAMAVTNGCDLNCGNLFGLLLQVINEGLLTEAQINQAVTRLMITRLRLGIIGEERSKFYDSISYEYLDSEENRALNLLAARKSLVLLKNDGTLPFNTTIKTIGVIGPNANSRAALEGNYVGTASEYITVLEGIRLMAKDMGKRLLYSQGCHLSKNRLHPEVSSSENDRLSEALIVTKRSDAVVVCLGLDASLEGEQGDEGNAFSAGDKISLKLPGKQQELLEEVTKAAAGKPVIVVMISGSAMDMCWADENTNGILQAFYPGALGGQAVAEALFGAFNPEGRLPLTFYRSDDDLPDFRDYDMTNRTYRYFNGEALYPFGFGLGYATFSLSDAAYSDGSITVKVKNEGGYKDSAATTVQVYTEVEGTKEHWNLCGLAHVSLSSGESKTITIPVNQAAFGRYDAQGQLQPCTGKKKLHIGFTQPDKRSIALAGTEPSTIII